MIMQESKSPMTAPQEQELEDLAAAAKHDGRRRRPDTKPRHPCPSGFRAQSIISHLGEKVCSSSHAPRSIGSRASGPAASARDPKRPHDRQIEHQVVHMTVSSPQRV